MARDVKFGVTVGIDIGGSKTRAVAVAGGRVIGDALAGSANLQSVTEEQAKAVFTDIFSRLNRSDISRVSAGSAGVDTAEGAQNLIRLLRPYAPDAEITAVHDTQLVLAAGGLTAGIAVISGTGSVAWGKRADGAVARVGGWGYLLGDDGSGYGVSRCAVPEIRRGMRRHRTRTTTRPFLRPLRAAVLGQDGGACFRSRRHR
ncbi:ATPase, BadF/BadG/BcrA/BcrD type [Mycobacteroides abscessus subsp. abscessus]|nr:ATPase, BadF/BadG/BcrA/BcrD type [Mycobacteroides abscessus subsp. abscessus]